MKNGNIIKSPQTEIERHADEPFIRPDLMTAEGSDEVIALPCQQTEAEFTQSGENLSDIYISHSGSRPLQGPIISATIVRRSGWRDPKMIDLFQNNDNHQNNAQVAQNIPKADLLANLLKKPQTFDEFDSAWRLAMWLLMVQNGIVINSYENIATNLGNISKSSVRKWADTLVKHGVIERTQKGNQVELKLCGEYMTCATAPTEPHTASQILPPVPPSLLALQKIFDGTEELGGNFSIRIDGIKMGSRK